MVTLFNVPFEREELSNCEYAFVSEEPGRRLTACFVDPDQPEECDQLFTVHEEQLNMFLGGILEETQERAEYNEATLKASQSFLKKPETRAFLLRILACNADLAMTHHPEDAVQFTIGYRELVREYSEYLVELQEFPLEV